MSELAAVRTVLRCVVVGVAGVLIILVGCRGARSGEAGSADSALAGGTELSTDSARVVQLLVDSLNLEVGRQVRVTTFVADPDGYLVRLQPLPYGATYLVWIYRTAEVRLLRVHRS